MPNPPFLVDTWARSQDSWDNSSQAFHQVHLLRAQEKAVRGHRPSAVADLAPAEAEAKEDEGSDWGQEAHDLGHESLGTRQLPLELEEAEAGGTEGCSPQGEACVVSNPPSCSGLGRVYRGRQGLGQDALALCEVQLKARVVRAFLNAWEGLCGLVGRRKRGRRCRLRGSQRATAGFLESSQEETLALRRTWGQVWSRQHTAQTGRLGFGKRSQLSTGTPGQQ